MSKKTESTANLLGIVLRDVSRSFYLTLRILPSPLRIPIGLAYLLARAADTIADTEIIPASERLNRLLQFRETLKSHQSVSSEMIAHVFWKTIIQDASSRTQPTAEQKLLILLPECFQLFSSLSALDQGLVVEVVAELTTGMEMDLKRFSDPNHLKALQTLEELEEYTYYVAGCVGPFWTKMCMAHLPEFQDWDARRMCDLGIHFGKALQWTNVLRDIPRDIQNGRCYLPEDDLKEVGLTPPDLKLPSNYPKLQNLYHRYLDHALEHYRAAWEYTGAIPKSSSRLRLACIWPQWIGLKTIALLRRAENPLDSSDRIRIPRMSVYGIMIRSICCLPFPSVLESKQEKLMKASNR